MLQLVVPHHERAGPTRRQVKGRPHFTLRTVTTSSLYLYSCSVVDLHVLLVGPWVEYCPSLLTTSLDVIRTLTTYHAPNPQEPSNSNPSYAGRWVGDASLYSVGVLQTEGQFHRSVHRGLRLPGRFANAQDGSTAPRFRMGLSESPAYAVAECARWRRARGIRPVPMQRLGYHFSRVMPPQIADALSRGWEGYPRAAYEDDEEMEQVD